MPPFDIAVTRNYAYAAYTHIRYAMDASGLGMTDKASLWESSGRNLYLGTKDFSGASWVNQERWNTDGTYNGLIVKSKNTPTPWNGLSQYLTVLLGEEYTFSGYVKNGSVGQVAFYAAGYTGNTNNAGVKITHAENWTKLSVTFKVTAAGTIRPRFENGIEGGTIYVCGLKLERGSTATSWTPAPEDYPEDYKQPYIGICQTNDPIAPTDPAAYVWTENKGGNI